TSRDAIDKLEWSHVRSATWAIHREEAQTRDIETVQVMICERHKLACLLASRVGGDGEVHDVLLCKEFLGAAAVDTAAACKHKVLAPMCASKIEQPRGALNVAVDVHIRVLDTWANSCSSSQVADVVW